MIYKSASEHAQAVKNGDYRITDLINNYYDRIDDYNKKINAIVITNKEAALSRAKVLEQAMDEGDVSGRLYGVPVTVKEAFNVKGLKTTVNFPKLKDHIANTDSIFVRRLHEEGAIILGKTNVPLLLSDSQTFGPLYPTCNNPYDLSRTPGGSTGGGAAAVASGMTTIELGSDIGGSIRNPAHYCGIFGLKPTQNGHHQDGHIPPLPGSFSGVRAMESTGPLARTMDDIELAYDVLYAPRWDYMKFLPVDHRLKERDRISEYKVGYFTHMEPYACSNDTVKVMKECVDRLKSEGVVLEKMDLDPKWVEEVMEIWAFLFGIVMGQDANWFVRQLLKLKFRKDTGGKINLLPSLKKGLSLGFKDYSRVLRRQQECKMELNKIFDRYDFVICPTSAGPAFHHNPKHRPIIMDGKPTHYFDYCFPYAMLYNAMENPVLDFPAGQDSQGLPIGLQIAAPQYAERPLIHFGKMIEKLGYQFRPPV